MRHLLGPRRQPPRQFGRWAFAEFTSAYELDDDLEELIDSFIKEAV
jgi:hypothetical protein